MFLKALQEDTGNNFISRPYEHSQYLPMVEGDSLPQGKVSPPPPQLSFMLSVLCNDKENEKSLVI